MAKIKIKDLPRDVKISEGEMRKARGGTLPGSIPHPRSLRKVGVLPLYLGPKPVDLTLDPAPDYLVDEDRSQQGPEIPGPDN